MSGESGGERKKVAGGGVSEMVLGGALKGMFRKRNSSHSSSRSSSLIGRSVADESCRSMQDSCLSSSRTNSDQKQENKGGESSVQMLWDLKSCVDIIESLIHHNSAITANLSKDQKAAIGNLRSLTATTSSLSMGRHHPQQQQQKRPSAKVKFGESIIKRFAGRNSNNKSSPFTRQKSLFMTEEMRETWMEVASDQEDKDRQQVVHEVLEAFGGGRFDPAWGGTDNIPMSLKRSSLTQGKSTRRSAVASQGMSSILTEFKGDSIHALATTQNSSFAIANYCPPEWNRLTPDAKTDLAHLLSVESLSRWDFDVVKVADLTRLTLSSRSSFSMFEGMFTPTKPAEEGEGKEKDASCIENDDEQFCPLLFVGWAILCAPMAQRAMEGSLEGYVATREPSHQILNTIDNNNNINNHHNNNSYEKKFHHAFDDHLKINPEAICNFLREIERRYSPKIPYHNNTHAADVTQTLHCLFGLIGKDLLYSISTPLEIFALLLAAAFHDVGHPGTNNLFHKNAMTSFAMQYNDVSILENMHAAVGHSILMGDEKKDDWDVFKGWDRSQIVQARGIMIHAILGTDMSNHFFKMDDLIEKIESVRFTASIVLQSESGEEILEENEDPATRRRSRDERNQQQMLELLGQPNTRILSRGDDDDEKDQQQAILDILAKMRGKPMLHICADRESSKTYADLKTECGELSSQILMFLLHSADISNPTKPQATAVRWAHSALSEFFAQGEKEKELSLPVSPLCDKQTTKTADSQIGFLQFVVRPTYALLGDIIPRVKQEVLPIIDQNLEYWKEMKRRESFQRKREQQH